MESKTHWKKLHNPDYLGAYSLEPGKDKIVKILYAETASVESERGKEVKMILRLEGEKPMIVNATNAKTITKALGSPMIEDWAGKHISLYATNVKAFGDIVEALRVRPIAPKLEKDTLTPERFEAMQKAIASGQFSVEAAKEKFALTPDQLAILEGGGNV